MTDESTSEKGRARGMGRVCWRNGHPWIEYYTPGDTKKHRESVRRVLRKPTATEADAVRLLKHRIGQIANQSYIGRTGERLTLANLEAMVIADYEANGRASLPDAKNSFRHLRDALGATTPVVAITSDRLVRYVADRRVEKAAAGTIRNELMALSKGFKLARVAHRVPRPEFPTVRTASPRQGFFEHKELEKVVAHLPPELVPFVRFLALTGWRAGEAMGLTWRQVDLAAGVVRLEPGTTKNGHGRTFPIAALPPLLELLKQQRKATKALERRQGCIVPHVFHRDGQPIRSYDDAWRTACEDAGLPGKLVHDLRRTATRNLERAGVPRSVAMKLTGHLTESVYRRYAITNEADLAEGVAKLAHLHAATMGTIRAQSAATGTGAENDDDA
jgi:integrase